MKYINVMIRVGTSRIIATLRRSAANWPKIRAVVAAYPRSFIRLRVRCCAG
jgi:hypothetical protein